MPRPSWVIAPDQLLPLFRATDLDALIDAAFVVLRGSVSCDVASAFYRNAGNQLLRQRDSRGREWSAAHMRRSAELNPAIPMALADPGVRILATRHAFTGREPALLKSPFYREVMVVEGWRHSVALCFWGEPRLELPVFVASVYRSEGKPDFSKRDIARLEELHPFLEAAVNRVYDHEAARSVRDGMAMAVSDGPRGFAILDWRLLLVQANPLARRLCAAWINGRATTARAANVRWTLPPALAAVCRELRDEWQSALRSNPNAPASRTMRQIQHPARPALTASITIVSPDATSLSEPTFLINFDLGESPSARVDAANEAAPVLEKMTRAERTVAIALAEGSSNQEIAERLGKSVEAVKFLLHRIYQKTGIPSRAALVAVLHSGHGASPNR